jgi:hypothetical protein
MTQCDDQKKKYLDIITQAVNAATLTAKPDPNLIQIATPCNGQQVSQTQQLNTNIMTVFGSMVESAVFGGSLVNVFSNMNNFFNNYLADAFKIPNSTAGQIMNNAQLGTTVAQGQQQGQQYNPNDVKEIIDQTNKNVKELDDAVSKLGDLYAKAPQGESAQVSDAIRKAEQTIEKSIEEVNNLEQRLKQLELEMDEKSLQINDPKIREEIENKRQDIRKIEETAQKAKALLIKNRKKVKKFR